MHIHWFKVVKHVHGNFYEACRCNKRRIVQKNRNSPVDARWVETGIFAVEPTVAPANAGLALSDEPLIIEQLEPKTVADAPSTTPVRVTEKIKPATSTKWVPLDFKCRRCQAVPGSKCVNAQGGPAASHLERKQDAALKNAE